MVVSLPKKFRHKKTHKKLRALQNLLILQYMCKKKLTVKIQNSVSKKIGKKSQILMLTILNDFTILHVCLIPPLQYPVCIIGNLSAF